MVTIGQAVSWASTSHTHVSTSCDQAHEPVSVTGNQAATGTGNSGNIDCRSCTNCHGCAAVADPSQLGIRLADRVFGIGASTASDVRTVSRLMRIDIFVLTHLADSSGKGRGCIDCEISRVSVDVEG